MYLSPNIKTMFDRSATNVKAGKASRSDCVIISRYCNTMKSLAAVNGLDVRDICDLQESLLLSMDDDSILNEVDCSFLPFNLRCAVDLRIPYMFDITFWTTNIFDCNSVIVLDVGELYLTTLSTLDAALYRMQDRMTINLITMGASSTPPLNILGFDSLSSMHDILDRIEIEYMAAYLKARLYQPRGYHA